MFEGAIHAEYLVVPRILPGHRFQVSAGRRLGTLSTRYSGPSAVPESCLFVVDICPPFMTFHNLSSTEIPRQPMPSAANHLTPQVFAAAPAEDLDAALISGAMGGQHRTRRRAADRGKATRSTPRLLLNLEREGKRPILLHTTKVFNRGLSTPLSIIGRDAVSYSMAATLNGTPG